MNKARGLALLADLRARATASAASMSRMRRQNAEQFVFGQAGLLLLLGATVFYVPLFAPSYSGVVLRVTTAILFVIGSVGLLVQSAPVVGQAEAAAARIAALRAQLDAAFRALPVPPERAERLPDTFEVLSLDRLEFRYPDVAGEPGFAIGPLDLTLRRGEVVFLTGGNGAGKSTLLRLMTGLYFPTSGQIQLDRTAVTQGNIQDYRNLIGAVFGDYHLFRRLYVPPPGGIRQLEDGLAAMELAGKTALDGDAFTTLDLSAGQRRRLALLLALLQDRPILVLDEVTADFDPSFRRHFYETILPELRRAGKTIIAATHEDRYFGCADRVLRLEDGQILAFSESET
jgi:putative ATP-binding cassette transporter